MTIYRKPIYRKDVGSECNTERRKFWEMCVIYSISWNRTDSIKLADEVLAEWDKRWIVKETDNDEQENENA